MWCVFLLSSCSDCAPHSFLGLYCSITWPESTRSASACPTTLSTAHSSSMRWRRNWTSNPAAAAHTTTDYYWDIQAILWDRKDAALSRVPSLGGCMELQHIKCRLYCIHNDQSTFLAFKRLFCALTVCSVCTVRKSFEIRRPWKITWERSNTGASTPAITTMIASMSSITWYVFQVMYIRV